MNILNILQSIAPSLFKIIDDAVGDKDLAAKLKHDLSVQMLNSKSDLVKSSADVIMSEAKGESWLQRNWRPMLMIWFSLLIGGYWFGFVPVNMPTEIVEKLFDLVTIGVGGYVIGRSGEKVVGSLAGAVTEGLAKR